MENYQTWTITENTFAHAQSMKDKLTIFIQYASLAPNAHNTQPWRFSITDSTVNLYQVYDRALTYSDRTRREEYIGFGCVIENFVLAANHFGYSVTVLLSPESSKEPIVAQLTVQEDEHAIQNDSLGLFAAIVNRSTNRSKYQQKLLPQNFITQAEQLAQPTSQVVINQEKRVIDAAAQLIAEAHTAAFNDPAFKYELAQWVRPNNTKRFDGMPLSGHGMPLVLSFFGSFLLQHMPAKMQAQHDKALVKSSPGIFVIAAADDTKSAWITTGRTLERVALYAQTQGIAVAPLAAIIEMQLLNQKLQELLQLEKKPTFFARIGYPTKPSKHTPRRTITDIMS